VPSVSPSSLFGTPWVRVTTLLPNGGCGQAAAQQGRAWCMGRGGGGGIGRGFMIEKPTRPVKKGTTRRVMAYFRPYRAQVALVLVAILIAAILGLATPLLLKLIIDDAIQKRDLSKLTLYAGLMIAVPLITGLINVGQTYLNNLVGQRVMRDLRNRLYEHLQAMSLRFFSDTRTGEIQSRLSNDVGGVQNVITNTATSMVSNVTIVSSTIVAMLITSWQLTIIALFFLPLFLYLTYRVGNIRREISRNTQRSMADMSALVEETLSVSGVLLTKTFGRQQQSLKRFHTENQRLADLQMRQQMVGRWFFMLIQTFFAITPAVAYYVAGRMILGAPPHHAAITIGGIVTFTTLQRQLFFPIGQLLTIQVEMQAALALFDRIFEYLDMPIEIADRPNAIVLDPARVRGDIEFDHVSFRYEEASERPALDNVSFHATPGQLVALVGPSGAGKTTISYLLTRLYDPQTGAVRIDGIDVRDVTLESLAEIIGVVTQETYLFHASIRENLAFARPDATDAELMAAVRAANIEERILELPDGLDTIVGERGYRMSGGEKQRLAIARVVLKNPRILVLDEATSALDSRSERLIQAALRPLMQGRTTVAIAHRLSTILAADQILVVEGGRIVERGTHASLLVRSGAYARLYHEQFQDGRVEAQCEDGVVEAAS
jgi:ATP-binding cassette, subfamily B, bacterial